MSESKDPMENAHLGWAVFALLCVLLAVIASAAGLMVLLRDGIGRLNAGAFYAAIAAAFFMVAEASRQRAFPAAEEEAEPGWVDPWNRREA